MKIYSTKFQGLKIIKRQLFYDSRGYFQEVYKQKNLKVHKPIFWCMSKSKKNVLRGLHLQTKNAQEKFISVVKGKILDVVVDLRHNSKNFGEHFKIILSAKNANSILIPAGFAHGFLSLEKENVVLYSNDNYRSQKNEIGLLWNDKDLNIKWPKSKLVISKKDRLNMTFHDFCKKYNKYKKK